MPIPSTGFFLSFFFRLKDFFFGHLTQLTIFVFGLALSQEILCPKFYIHNFFSQSFTRLRGFFTQIAKLSNVLRLAKLVSRRESNYNGVPCLHTLLNTKLSWVNNHMTHTQNNDIHINKTRDCFQTIQYHHLRKSIFITSAYSLSSTS